MIKTGEIIYWAVGRLGVCTGLKIRLTWFESGTAHNIELLFKSNSRRVIEFYIIKHYNDSLCTTRKILLFSISLSTDKKFYLLESEYKKFKDIIHG